MEVRQEEATRCKVRTRKPGLRTQVHHPREVRRNKGLRTVRLHPRSTDTSNPSVGRPDRRRRPASTTCRTRRRRGTTRRVALLRMEVHLVLR